MKLQTVKQKKKKRVLDCCKLRQKPLSTDTDNLFLRLSFHFISIKPSINKTTFQSKVSGVTPTSDMLLLFTLDSTFFLRSFSLFVSLTLMLSVSTFQTTGRPHSSHVTSAAGPHLSAKVDWLHLWAVWSCRQGGGSYNTDTPTAETFINLEFNNSSHIKNTNFNVFYKI